MSKKLVLLHIQIQQPISLICKAVCGFDKADDKINVSSKNNEHEFICFEANQSSSNCESFGSAAVLKAHSLQRKSSEHL